MKRSAVMDKAHGYSGSSMPSRSRLLRRIRNGWVGACLFLAVAGVPFTIFAKSVTLLPSADTTLFELEPDFNFGKQATLPIGTLADSPANRARSRGLFRFDVASHVPEGSEIEFASLQMTVVRSPPNAASASFSLHRMLREWHEGKKEGTRPGGDQASSGESTWSRRHYPDGTWGSPGGEAGIDFEAEPMSSERVADGTEYSFELGRQGIQDIQEWIAFGTL